MKRKGWTSLKSVTLLAFSLALVHMPSGMPAPFYPLYIERFAIDSSDISAMFATYIMGVVAGLLLMPRVVGYAWILPALCVLTALGDGAFLLARSVEFIYAGHFLTGLSLGTFTGIVPLILTGFDADGRAKLSGRVTTSANAVGLTIGPIFSGLLIAFIQDGQELAWLIHMALCLMVAPFMQFSAKRTGTSGVGGPSVTPNQVTIHLRNGHLALAATIAGFTAFASGGLLGALGSVAVHTVLGEPNSAVQGIVVATCFAISSITGALHVSHNDKKTIALGLGFVALGCVGLVASILAVSVLILVTAAALCGVGQGFALQGATQVVGQRSGVADAGKAISAFFIRCYFGTILSSFGTGLILQVLDLGSAFMLISAVMTLMSGLGLGILVRNRAVAPA